MKILVVCLGNICRSPMAEGILQRLVADASLSWQIDSAGTSDWHNGEQPDRRAMRTCQRRGIDISNQRSRLFTSGDFESYDRIITMDDTNYQEVIRMANGDAQRQKVTKIMSYAPEFGDHVPDPYFDNSFEEVYDLLDSVCRKVIENLRGVPENIGR